MRRLHPCFGSRRARSTWPTRFLCSIHTAAVLVVVLAGGVPVRAVELYWDINGATAGAGGTAPAGTWNATNTYWNTDSTGGGSGTISAWQPGEVAVFSAGTGATGLFTVAVSGTQQIDGLRFEEGRVTLSGGNLQFSGGATFTHDAAAGDCPVNSKVQGNGELLLAGTGTWGRLNGVTSDSGGVLNVKVTGSYVFGGQHTYTGGAEIDGGYVVPTVSSTGPAGSPTSGPFGTGTLILTSGTLRPTSGGAITLANPVTLNGDVAFGTGDTTNNLTFTGPLTLTGNRTLTSNYSNVFFNGALGETSSFGFTKSGTSALILGEDNTFTGGVTIAAGELKLNHAGALNSTSPNAVTFSSNTSAKTLTLNGNSVTVAGLSNSGGSGAVVQNNASGTATLTVDNAIANTFAGVLQNGSTGALALTKTGAGTLTLSGSSANTYTGSTTVGGGILRLGKSSGVNAIAGNIVVNGGELQWGASNQIADTASIVLNSGKLWTTLAESVANVTINAAASSDFHLINSLNVTGTLTITAGDVVVGSGGSAEAAAVDMTGGKLSVAANTDDSTFTIGNGGLTMSGATLQLGYSGLAPTALINLGGDFSGSGVNNISTPNHSGPRLLDLQGATRTFDVTGGTTTISPTIQNGGLTKTGAGTLVLSASNTYTGGTTVSGGTLRLGADDALADTGAVTVGGGTLDINTRDDTVGAVTLTSGSITGTTGVLTGSSYDVRNGTISAALGGSGALTKSTGSTVTLSGSSSNTYSGLTTVDGGTLSLSKSGGATAIAGDILVNSGTLVLGANHQIANTSDITVNGSANFNNAGRTDTVGNVTLNSSYSDPNTHRLSNLTIAGTLTMTDGVAGLNSGATTTANAVNMSGGSQIHFAANTANTTLNIGSGGLTMSGATLRLGWTGLGSAQIARVNLGGDFTGSGTNNIDYYTTDNLRLLDLQGAARTFDITSGTTTIDPTIQNGGLSKTGAGTLTLSGANTYTGDTLISDGTLALTGSGSIASPVISVGPDGVFDVSTVTGGFTLGAAQTLNGTGTVLGPMAVDGTVAPGTSPGVLHTADVLFTDGSTFAVELNGPTAGTEYDQLEVAGAVGLAGTLEASLGYTPALGDLFFIIRNDGTEPVSGTFDGLDDHASLYLPHSGGDQLFWISYFGDWDSQSITGGNDVVLIAVPEPTSLALLGLGALGLLRRRRKG